MSLIVAEYECPVHGRFELTVERPAPDVVACHVAICPMRLDGTGPGEYEITDRCPMLASWRISAPKVRPQYGCASQGKSEPRPSSYMDTRTLGEGQPLSEWRADRARQHDEQRRRTLKDL